MTGLSLFLTAYAVGLVCGLVAWLIRTGVNKS